MYYTGRGVPQDFVQAYMWCNLAVWRYGDAENREDGIKCRDAAASRMVPAQIAEAQELTRITNQRLPQATLFPQSPQNARIEDNKTPTNPTGVPMKKIGGTFVVPVEINGAIKLDFTIDSGAADVSVPLDVFSTLRRQGTIQDADIAGQQTYVLADGSERQTFTFTIRSLKVGDTIIYNVGGSVAPLQGSLLLGQSFLERFKSWSIDNTKNVLLLQPR
jgi:clan AA aspartic protease (TIGR02281 family)